MALLRFYSTGLPFYRDEREDESMDWVLRRFNPENRELSANIFEKDKEFSLELALPGVDKKDIRMKHEKGYLTISVENNKENSAGEKYALREFNYSGLSRTFKTGKEINAEMISAQYENGILSVHLPKKETVSHTIAIE